MIVSFFTISILFYFFCIIHWSLHLVPQARGETKFYLDVSESGGYLGHVQAEAPGCASGAVDMLLNFLRLRWAPASTAHRQHRPEQHRTDPEHWHRSAGKHWTTATNGRTQWKAQMSVTSCPRALWLQNKQSTSSCAQLLLLRGSTPPPSLRTLPLPVRVLQASNEKSSKTIIIVAIYSSLLHVFKPHQQK